MMSEPPHNEPQAADDEGVSVDTSELREQFEGLLPVDRSKPPDPWPVYRDKLRETLQKLHELGGFSEDEYRELSRLLGKGGSLPRPDTRAGADRRRDA
jgi:hypothetical protein